ncbi:SpoIID/LytB domain-containing protein [Thermanaeromonas sp. C210]|uniref:SpoIID/LytB domain-containing protein n=1 Tax=Thermanaeromonas sp. C210 TaxID=2731925 RepID=UPI00155C1DA0|nr:SpoIID/LytB domain-containing protein [Thermanaeromonas sp. C210]GFN23193.1 sporulation protein [Thermanaeromonas sp. C210]
MGRKTLRGGILFLFLLTVTLLPSPAGAGDPDSPSIRVLLDRGLSRVSFEAVQGSYRLVDGQGKELARPGTGESWEVRLEEGQLRLFKEGQALPPVRVGRVEFKPADEKASNLFKYQGKRYRGSLRILYEGTGLAAINSLDVEQYLYGVVGAEMGTGAGLEALKAQAVVSRTFALSRVRPAAPYDVTDDTSTQVYDGYEAEVVPGADKVKQAVDSTRGQVIYYDGKLIEAYFHSNAGGHTEDSENVWSAALPYLRGVPSPEDEHALQYSGWPADTYRWTLSLTREEIQRRVEAWLERTGQKTEIGQVRELVVSRQRSDGSGPTISGRATRLDIIGDRSAVSAYRDGIRSVLGLRSTLFTLETDSTVAVVDARGNRRELSYGGELVAVGAKGAPDAVNGAAGEYVVAGRDGSRTVPKVFRQVVIQGRGNGHGLGLSQWGARGMAAKGYSYREIIEHYYNQDRRDGKLVVAPFAGR